MPAPSNTGYTDKTLMPFGKHKGRYLEDVPADYLLYLYSKKPLSDESLERYIEDNLDVLKKQEREMNKFGNR